MGVRGEWRESRHTNCNRSPGTGESLMRGQGGVFTAQPHDRGMQSARLKMKYCLDAWFICSHAKKIIIFAINTDFRDKRASNILAHKTCVPVSDNGWVHPSFVIIKTTSVTPDTQLNRRLQKKKKSRMHSAGQSLETTVENYYSTIIRAIHYSLSQT